MHPWHVQCIRRGSRVDCHKRCTPGVVHQHATRSNGVANRAQRATCSNYRAISAVSRFLIRQWFSMAIRRFFLFETFFFWPKYYMQNWWKCRILYRVRFDEFIHPTCPLDVSICCALLHIFVAVSLALFENDLFYNFIWHFMTFISISLKKWRLWVITVYFKNIVRYIYFDVNNSNMCALHKIL